MYIARKGFESDARDHSFVVLRVGGPEKGHLFTVSVALERLHLHLVEQVPILVAILHRSARSMTRCASLAVGRSGGPPCKSILIQLKNMRQ